MEPKKRKVVKIKRRKVKRSWLRKYSKTSLIKKGSLFLLVAQMVGLVLLMRYSRMISNPDDLYLASTAVFSMEVLKFLVCTVVIYAQGGSSLENLFEELRYHLLDSPFEVLKLCVPSFLYTIQNNLLYCALSNLDAATYQVCYQLKILTTALFSVIMLQKKLSATKWFSLILLTVGVIIVQLSNSSDGGAGGSGKEDGDGGNEALNARQDRMLGLISVLCAACTSGFSGVYFEKILKQSLPLPANKGGDSEGSPSSKPAVKPVSLWARNLQMGLPSIVISLVTVFVQDVEVVKTRGFFTGYTFVVWTVVFVQAIGGLIVALVVKYTDNVAKVFATSISIIFSCVISAFMFDFRPNLQFVLGAFLVMSATVIYSGIPVNSSSTLKKRAASMKKDAILPLVAGTKE